MGKKDKIFRKSAASFWAMLSEKAIILKKEGISDFLPTISKKTLIYPFNNAIDN